LVLLDFDVLVGFKGNGFFIKTMAGNG